MVNKFSILLVIVLVGGFLALGGADIARNAKSEIQKLASATRQKIDEVKQ